MANDESEDTMINIELLESSLEKKIAAKNLFMSPKCCIFKTPEILYRHNEKAYVPDAFSIGPFHRGKQNLKATEKMKYKYLQGLVNRRKIRVRQFIDVIKEVEKEVRECYAGPVNLSKEDFVEMLVLDGCFIIELFRKDADEVSRDPDDPIFTMSCILQFLYHDLILLENQIPWLVLVRLFNITADLGSKPLLQLTLEFFSNMFSSTKPSIESKHFANYEIKHILDLLRCSLIFPSKKEKRDEDLGWQPFPSATSLGEAGIKFMKVTSNSILDVKFNDGVLEMPSLLIQETTETIFRNLISFEQCYPNCSPRITSYAKLMDNLIDSTKDMKLLCENEIIDNWLDPEDATEFFNKLYNDAYIKEFYYLRLCSEVNIYCKRRWHRWHAFLMHNYFGTPWAIVGQVVAATLLILTFLQTVYSIIN